MSFSPSSVFYVRELGSSEFTSSRGRVGELLALASANRIAVLDVAASPHPIIRLYPSTERANFDPLTSALLVNAISDGYGEFSLGGNTTGLEWITTPRVPSFATTFLASLFLRHDALWIAMRTNNEVLTSSSAPSLANLESEWELVPLAEVNPPGASAPPTKKLPFE